MKKNVLSSLFLAFYAFTLASCGPTSRALGSNTPYVPNINNSTDLEDYSGTDYETTDEDYHTSKYISFIMSVKGYYQTNIPFTLDKNNENLRIYDNMYFYEKDYFELMSSDYKYIWATLKNENTPYLTPLREDGEDIQVNVKKSGIYKIILDITTMIMDFEYKSEITTPYYYPFKTCEIGTLVDGHIVYNALSVNPSNEDEFFINDYEAQTGKLYFFSNAISHTSSYKLTINENSKQYLTETMFEDNIGFNVSGKFNIFVNKKTYEVRAVPTDPSQMVYDCLTYLNGEFITLSPKDPNVPYLFEYNYEATSDVGGYGIMSDDVPSFYNKTYKEYALTVEESPLLGKGSKKYYFKKAGKYILTIDLLNLTLKVETDE